MKYRKLKEVYMERVDSAINPFLGDYITIDSQPYMGNGLIKVEVHVNGDVQSIRVKLSDLEAALEKLKKEEKSNESPNS